MNLATAGFPPPCCSACRRQNQAGSGGGARETAIFPVRPHTPSHDSRVNFFPPRSRLLVALALLLALVLRIRRSLEGPHSFLVPRRKRQVQRPVPTVVPRIQRRPPPDELGNGGDVADSRCFMQGGAPPPVGYVQRRARLQEAV